MSSFRIRPLHRQRGRRRATATVLDQAELARHFDVPVAALKAALEAANWYYHEDAAGNLWASVQKRRLQEPSAGPQPDDLPDG